MPNPLSLNSPQEVADFERVEQISVDQHSLIVQHHTVVNANWIILSLVLVILDYSQEIRMTQVFNVGIQKHQNVFVLDFAIVFS